MNADEDPLAYQRRRDVARANFLMIERGHEEDDNSFRQRLDDMTEKFREKRRAWSDSASQSGRATKEKGRAALGRAQDLYDRNPLIGGIIAAAAGAALGSSLPISRQEQEKLGSVGAKARDLASDQKDQLTSQAREKKDELVQKADEKLQASESSGEPSRERDAPFMIGDGPR